MAGMKPILFFQLLLNMLFAILLLVTGLALSCYPTTKEHYEPLWRFTEEHFWVIPLAGGILALFGLAIFLRICSHFKKCHFKIASSQMKVWVDSGILEKIVQEFWKENFPEETLSCQAYIHKNQIQITAEIGSHFNDDAFIEELIDQMRSRLHKYLGYLGNITLSFIKKEA